MFILSLFKITKPRNYPVFFGYDISHIAEAVMLFSNRKKETNDICKTWMDLKCIMLSERNWT